MPRKYWEKGVVRTFLNFKKATLGRILGKGGGTQISPQKILVNRGGTQIGTF